MSKGGDIDPMLPGKKMMAIFGFCDIRNFADCTGKLYIYKKIQRFYRPVNFFLSMKSQK